MKKINFNLAFCLLAIIILISYVLFIEGPSKFISLFQSLEYYWVAIGALFMVLYLLIESYIFHIITKSSHKTLTFADSFRISMIGQLFNCITPFSSGGQPIQAYHMHKIGINLGTSTSCLLSKFIVYQVSLTFYTFVILLFQYKFFTDKVPGFAALALVGFLINCLVVIGLIVIALFPKWVKTIGVKLIILLKNMNIIKESDSKIDYLSKTIENFTAEFKKMKHHIPLLLFSFLLNLVQITAFFLIPYAVYRSFSLTLASPIAIISAAAFVMLITAFIPIPGTIGAAEGGFFILFQIFFSPSNITFAILLWRVFTFIMPISIGSIALLFNKAEKTLDKKGIISK